MIVLLVNLRASSEAEGRQVQWRRVSRDEPAGSRKLGRATDPGGISESSGECQKTRYANCLRLACQEGLHHNCASTVTCRCNPSANASNTALHAALWRRSSCIAIHMSSFIENSLASRRCSGGSLR